MRGNPKADWLQPKGPRCWGWTQPWKKYLRPQTPTLPMESREMLARDWAFYIIAIHSLRLGIKLLQESPTQARVS